MTATYDVIFAGVGGQGVISASGLLARAAIGSGLDVRMYGSYGMAQRGGSVSAQVRIGERVLNARIEKGEARLLVGLELIEAVRWVPFLSGEGALVVNDDLVPPVGRIIRDDGARLRQFLGSVPRATVLDAGKLAGPSGSRGVSAVLLGAASSVRGFPVPAGALESVFRRDFGSRSGQLIAAFRRARAEPGKAGE
jgi:indolepyruvate ferredoxin oxidoreductase beta subunit